MIYFYFIKMGILFNLSKKNYIHVNIQKIKSTTSQQQEFSCYVPHNFMRN